MTDLMKISPGSIHSSSDGLKKSRIVALFVIGKKSVLYIGRTGDKKQVSVDNRPFSYFINITVAKPT